MKTYISWLPLLLNAVGCASSQSVSPPSDSPAAPVQVTPVQATPVQATPIRSPQPGYAPTAAPLPTGQVTLRADIRNLETSRLIAACPTDSAPYAFAESNHYQIQICSQEYDPWQPKYYIGQSKTDQGSLNITSTNPDEARQLIFKNAGYTYRLRRGHRSS